MPHDGPSAAPRRALAALALLTISSLALAQNGKQRPRPAAAPGGQRPPPAEPAPAPRPSPAAVTAPCPDGFSGPSCALCQSDAACAAATGAAAATCSQQLAFSPDSTLKSFACNVPASDFVGGLLEPGSLLVQCTPAASECTLGFKVKAGGVAVGCEASGCTFVNGQASLNCSATACSCTADTTCGNNSEWRIVLKGLQVGPAAPLSMLLHDRARGQLGVRAPNARSRPALVRPPAAACSLPCKCCRFPRLLPLLQRSFRAWWAM